MDPYVYIHIDHARERFERIGMRVEIEPDRFGVYFGACRVGTTLLTEDKKHISRYAFERMMYGPQS